MIPLATRYFGLSSLCCITMSARTLSAASVSWLTHSDSVNHHLLQLRCRIHRYLLLAMARRRRLSPGRRAPPWPSPYATATHGAVAQSSRHMASVSKAARAIVNGAAREMRLHGSRFSADGIAFGFARWAFRRSNGHFSILKQRTAIIHTCSALNFRLFTKRCSGFSSRHFICSYRCGRKILRRCSFVASHAQK